MKVDFHCSVKLNFKIVFETAVILGDKEEAGAGNNVEVTVGVTGVGGQEDLTQFLSMEVRERRKAEKLPILGSMIRRCKQRLWIP